MKKIAVFTEGQTEWIFAQRLIEYMAKARNLSVAIKAIKTITNISARPPLGDVEYVFMVLDCTGGDRVLSSIRENAQELKNAGYSLVIGIMDVFPCSNENIANLKKMRRRAVSKLPISANVFPAVMEVEAWFIAEETHFVRISPMLTVDVINRIAGIDVTNESTEIIPRPSETLDKIYHHAGLNRDKSRAWTIKIVSALDFTNMCGKVRTRSRSLDELLSCLDSVLAN